MHTVHAQLLSFLTLICYVQALPSQMSLGSAEQVTQRLMSRGEDMGIWLTNKSDRNVTFNFYNNFWNGDDKAGANFDHPEHETTLAPGKREFIELPDNFKGRVQRGNTIPATWVEFQTKAKDGHGHGDVSLEQGCDGAATITPEGGGPTGGFTDDVVTGAPEAAKVQKEDGTWAIASTEGNWMAGPNQAAIDHLQATVGQEKAYILGGTGVPDIMSENNKFEVVF